MTRIQIEIISLRMHQKECLNALKVGRNTIKLLKQKNEKLIVQLSEKKIIRLTEIEKIQKKIPLELNKIPKWQPKFPFNGIYRNIAVTQEPELLKKNKFTKIYSELYEALENSEDGDIIYVFELDYNPHFHRYIK